jgi:hypothetical protein
VIAARTNEEGHRLRRHASRPTARPWTLAITLVIVAHVTTANTG